MRDIQYELGYINSFDYDQADKYTPESYRAFVIALLRDSEATYDDMFG